MSVSCIVGQFFTIMSKVTRPSSSMQPTSASFVSRLGCSLWVVIVLGLLACVAGSLEPSPRGLWYASTAGLAAVQFYLALGNPLPGLRHDDFMELPDARPGNRCLANQRGWHIIGADCPGVHSSILLLPCARLLESPRMAVVQFSL